MQMKIGGRPVGPGHATYIIAEMSGNHNQDLGRALSILKAAAAAGADAVKLQTYTADTLTIDCDSPYFRIEGTPWSGKNLYQLYHKAHTPWEWHPSLQEAASELGIDLFSTPFDRTAVAFLAELDVPAYKVASFEIVDLPLLREIAAQRKPVIMSTGMASLSEIDAAVQTLREGGASEIALLKCTSAYPAPFEEMNLRTIPHLREAFQLPVGLSDHTLGSEIPIAAVVLGASIVEKHITLARADGGPDSSFSMEPEEFASMVRSIRNVEDALGRVSYRPTAKESESRVFRRSLFAVRTIRAGEVFTAENVRSIRPGYGLPPKYLEIVMGRHARRDIEAGTPLTWELVGTPD